MFGEVPQDGAFQTSASLDQEWLEKAYRELKKYESTLTHMIRSSDSGWGIESHPLWWRQKEVAAFVKELGEYLKHDREHFH